MKLIGHLPSTTAMDSSCVYTSSFDATPLAANSERATSSMSAMQPHTSEELEETVGSGEMFDCSLEDRKEEQAVEDFIRQGCTCHLGPQGSPCSQQLTRETIESTRQDCLDLTKSELDLVILSQIHSLQSTTQQHQSEHSVRSKPRSSYYIHGVQVCLSTYLYLHCVSRKRYQNLVQHYQQHGLCPRIHGNTKRLPVNSLPKDDTEYLTTFITNYARAHGMPLPGRIPGHRDKVMLLPSDITKVFVYNKYKEACIASGFRHAGKSKFYQVWQEVLPHISVSTPSSDLCFTCQQNNLAIQQSGCLPDVVKAQRLTAAQDHLALARTERMYYNAQVKAACESYSGKGATEKPCIAHYSYDFTQQVHFPFSAQQTGPEYFKTACKCGTFGVCNDGESRQVIYLIDEAENPGKGADCVISLLHHYFEHHGAGEKSMYLHADNCVGQNKNSATVQYLVWRVMTGRHESIELSFMLVGHTKFLPDRFFGLFKKAFRRSTM